MRRSWILAALGLVVGACSGGGGKCTGELATVGQGCAPMFDGTEANLPACSGPTQQQVVWQCQDLFILMPTFGLGGTVCYYDTTSHALVGAELVSDIGTYCNQTSLSIAAGRTNPMCRENAPLFMRSCPTPDGGS